MRPPEIWSEVGERIGSFFRPLRPLLTSLNTHKEEIVSFGLFAAGVIVSVPGAVWLYGQMIGNEMIQNSAPIVLIGTVAAIALSIPLAYYSARRPSS
jgi:hypothetical protein